MQEIEIEFLEWVHPQLGVTPVQVEGGKPLMLKAKIHAPKREWVEITKGECDQLFKTASDHIEYAFAIEKRIKELNT